MSTRAPTATRPPSRFTRDANGTQYEQEQPRYQSPSLRYDEFGNKINAHVQSAVIAPGTGGGTGRTGVITGYATPDGKRYPTTKMGSDTRPLSPPRPTMSAPSMTADQARANSEARARNALDFNQKNPGLHKDEITGRVMVHPDAENRIAAAKAKGDASSSGDQSTPPPTPPSQSSAGQAQSMREASAPNPGEDRYGRTSASPSAGGRPVVGPSSNPSSMARSEWQQGAPGTRSISGEHGSGSSKEDASPNRQPGKIIDPSYTPRTRPTPSGPPSAPAPAPPSSAPPATPATPAAPAAPTFKPQPLPTADNPNAGLRPDAPPATPATAAAPSPSLPPSKLTPDTQPTYPKGSFEQRAQSLGNAKSTLDNAAGAKAITDSSGAGPLAPTPSVPPSAMADATKAPTTPVAPPPTTSGGFTGDAGEAAARAASQQSKQDDLAAQESQRQAMNSLDSMKGTTFRQTPTPPTSSQRTTPAQDASDLARYKAEDAARAPTPAAPPSQMTGNPPPIPAIKEPTLPPQPGDPTPKQVAAAEKAAQNQDDGDGPDAEDKKDEKDDEEDRTV